MGQAKKDRAKKFAELNKESTCPKCGGGNIIGGTTPHSHKCCWCKTEWPDSRWDHSESVFTPKEQTMYWNEVEMEFDRNEDRWIDD